MTDARLTLSGIPVGGDVTVRAISPAHPTLGDFAIDLGVNANATLYVTSDYLTVLRDACTAALEAES